MGRLLAILSIIAAAGAARAEPPITPSIEIKVGPDRKVTAYKLETVELRGSTRMTGEQLARELGLVAGTPLDDELVMTTRSKLLGLGLFKSAILVMRKGSRPGHARLIVEVEDDEGVLTDWALGGELGVTVNESSASSVEANTAPMDYRLGLVARNLAAALHRGSAWVDIDNDGNFRQGQLAYGLPRFALEDVQFDAELAGVSVRHRYLDALGFGGRGQGLWSRTLGSQGEVQYGAAMYTNKKKSEFASPGFPRSVVGPKVAYWRETRLRSFFPGAGSLIGASVLLAPTRSDQSVVELALARTWSFSDWVYLTLDGRFLSVGVRDYAMRAEGRFDVPLGHAKADEDQAEIFLRLRGGVDKATYDEAELRNEGREGSAEDGVSLEGSAAIIGVRYHSSGFIAEFGIKVTRSPEELRPKAIGGDESPLTRLRSIERWEGSGP